MKKHFPIRGGLLSRARGFVKAVDGVDLVIYRGESLGLVGESGCGKTTLGRLLLHLIDATEGELYFDAPEKAYREIATLKSQLSGRGQGEAANGGSPMAPGEAQHPRLGPSTDSSKVLRKNLIQLRRRYDLQKMNRRSVRGYRRRMQIVFQDPFSSLNPRMLVKDIVAEPLRVHRIYAGPGLRKRTAEIWRGWKGLRDGGRPLRDRVRELLRAHGRLFATFGKAAAERQKAQELLETVGLNREHLYRFPHEFSGGQRQRIGIARALALNPDFIILDEPTSALDVSVQAQILNLLKDLQQRYELTYLFISHHLSVIRHMCDRVSVMYLGEIVEEAPTEDLFRQPLHPYTEALLSAIPTPDPDAKALGSRILLPGDVPSPANPPTGCRFHPRCPIADNICGWDATEVAEALQGLTERARASGVAEARAVASIDVHDATHLTIRLVSADGVAREQAAAWLQAFIKARAVESRRLGAVEAFGLVPEGLRLTLLEPREPVLKVSREGRNVRCLLRPPYGV